MPYVKIKWVTEECNESDCPGIDCDDCEHRIFKNNVFAGDVKSVEYSENENFSNGFDIIKNLEIVINSKKKIRLEQRAYQICRPINYLEIDHEVIINNA